MGVSLCPMEAGSLYQYRCDWKLSHLSGKLSCDPQQVLSHRVMFGLSVELWMQLAQGEILLVILYSLVYKSFCSSHFRSLFFIHFKEEKIKHGQKHLNKHFPKKVVQVASN